MKVQELLANIHRKDFNLEKELQVKKYLPVMNKKKFVMDIIAVCTDDIDDFITIDKFKMNIYFDMCILGAYTNLEITSDFDEMVMQYDELCEYGYLADIIYIFQDDYDITHTILENELEALLIQNSIDTQVVKVANKINKVIDMISDKFNNIDFNSILPEGTDINELVKIIDILK